MAKKQAVRSRATASLPSARAATPGAAPKVESPSAEEPSQEQAAKETKAEENQTDSEEQIAQEDSIYEEEEVAEPQVQEEVAQNESAEPSPSLQSLMEEELSAGAQGPANLSASGGAPLLLAMDNSASRAPTSSTKPAGGSTAPSSGTSNSNVYIEEPASTPSTTVLATFNPGLLSPVCTFKLISAGSPPGVVVDKYEVTCNAMGRFPDGALRELTATQAVGLVPKWSNPLGVKGATIGRDDLQCRVENQGLRHICEINIPAKTHVQYTTQLSVASATSGPVEKEARVVLPFSIATLGNPRHLPVLNIISTANSIEYPFDSPALRSRFSKPTSLCFVKDRLYFASTRFIYVQTENSVELFAGSGNRQRLYALSALRSLSDVFSDSIAKNETCPVVSHRLNVAFGAENEDILPLHIACDARRNGIFVSDPYNHRVVFISLSDHGSVTQIAGVVQTDSIAQQTQQYNQQEQLQTSQNQQQGQTNTQQQIQRRAEGDEDSTPAPAQPWAAVGTALTYPQHLAILYGQDDQPDQLWIGSASAPHPSVVHLPKTPRPALADLSIKCGNTFPGSENQIQVSRGSLTKHFLRVPASAMLNLYANARNDAIYAAVNAIDPRAGYGSFVAKVDSSNLVSKNGLELPFQQLGKFNRQSGEPLYARHIEGLWVDSDEQIFVSQPRQDTISILASESGHYRDFDVYAGINAGSRATNFKPSFPDSNFQVIKFLNGFVPDFNPLRRKTLALFSYGSRTEVELNRPKGITRGPDGALYFANHGTATIGRIAPDTTTLGFTRQGIVSIASGAQSPFATSPTQPHKEVDFGFTTGVKFTAAGDLLITSFSGQKVFKIDSEGLAHRIAGLPGDSAAIELDKPCAQSKGPEGKSLATYALSYPTMAVERSNGDIYIAEFGTCRILKLTRDLTLTTLAYLPNLAIIKATKGDEEELEPCAGCRPYALAYDAVSDSLFFTAMDGDYGMVGKINLETTAYSHFLPASQKRLDGFRQPRGLAINPDEPFHPDAPNGPKGMIYLTEAGYDCQNNLGGYCHKVLKFDFAGNYRGKFPAQDGRGHNPDEDRFEGSTLSSAQFSNPTGLAFGLNGDLFVADTGNSRVKLVSPIKGRIKTFMGGEANGFSTNRNPCIASLSNSEPTREIGSIHAINSARPSLASYCMGAPVAIDVQSSCQERRMAFLSADGSEGFKTEVTGQVTMAFSNYFGGTGLFYEGFEGVITKVSYPCSFISPVHGEKTTAPPSPL